MNLTSFALNILKEQKMLECNRSQMALEMKSKFGYFILFGEHVIKWKSQKQRVVSLFHVKLDT